jgi:DNA-binding CsgD family transcriptional regulator
MERGAEHTLVRRARDDGDAETRHPSSLTIAERQVCELVAMGLTNRQIADERCVGVKAVEFHLHNAFVKLNVSNRTQLARYMLEHEQRETPPAAAALQRTSDVPAQATVPGAATPADVEPTARQMLGEVLEEISSELGARHLTDAELTRLHDCVADEVTQTVAVRFDLDQPQSAALREQLRRMLEADELDLLIPR